MTFHEFQRQAMNSAIYPNLGNNITYPALGLCGEAGEVAEKIKKLIRDKNNIQDIVFQQAVSKELGDVLWYIAALCLECSLDMENVALGNLEKLNSRKDRGVLQGSGDNR